MGSIFQGSILRVEGTACCPANVYHDAACNDDGGRISSVGKALECRAEDPGLYSLAGQILRLKVVPVALQTARPSDSLDKRLKTGFPMKKHVLAKHYPWCSSEHAFCAIESSTIM